MNGNCFLLIYLRSLYSSLPLFWGESIFFVQSSHSGGRYKSYFSIVCLYRANKKRTKFNYPSQIAHVA